MVTVKEMGVMVRGTNTELLTCHELHCTIRGRKSRGTELLLVIEITILKKLLFQSCISVQ